VCNLCAVQRNSRPWLHCKNCLSWVLGSFFCSTLRWRMYAKRRWNFDNITSTSRAQQITLRAETNSLEKWEGYDSIPNYVKLDKIMSTIKSTVIANIDNWTLPIRSILSHCCYWQELTNIFDYKQWRSTGGGGGQASAEIDQNVLKMRIFWKINRRSVGGSVPDCLRRLGGGTPVLLLLPTITTLSSF